jgi:hypothetical protein
MNLDNAIGMGVDWGKLSVVVKALCYKEEGRGFETL